MGGDGNAEDDFAQAASGYPPTANRRYGADLEGPSDAEKSSDQAS